MDRIKGQRRFRCHSFRGKRNEIRFANIEDWRFNIPLYEERISRYESHVSGMNQRILANSLIKLNNTSWHSLPGW